MTTVWLLISPGMCPLQHPLICTSRLEAKLGTFHCKALNSLSTGKVRSLHPCLSVLWHDSISKVLMPGFSNAANMKIEVVLVVLLGQMILVSLLTLLGPLCSCYLFAL